MQQREALLAALDAQLALVCYRDVSDSNAGTCKRLWRDGEELSAGGAVVVESSAVYSPDVAALGGGRLAVADSDNHRVVVVDAGTGAVERTALSRKGGHASKELAASRCGARGWWVRLPSTHIVPQAAGGVDGGGGKGDNEGGGGGGDGGGGG